MATIYYVAKSGSDRNPGTKNCPFLTIQRAADVAVAGDTVIVHEGVYREWVKPRYGGLTSDCRITYMAAQGEHVVIKGSEQVDNWELCGKQKLIILFLGITIHLPRKLMVTGW